MAVASFNAPSPCRPPAVCVRPWSRPILLEEDRAYFSTTKSSAAIAAFTAASVEG